MLNELKENQKIILFDGVCNLCDAAVQFIIKHDKNNVFLYAPLQGETGQRILSQYHVDRSKMDSIILYSKDAGVAFKSTAALKIAAKLGFPLNLLAIFLIIPNFIRNWVYDYIAKNRYKWYGKKSECMIPTPQLKAKFLD